MDGSPAARAAARLAFEEARLRGVELIVALAWPPARTWPEAVAASAGSAGLLMDGTCRALIDHAPCPVLVLPRGVLPA